MRLGAGIEFFLLPCKHFPCGRAGETRSTLAVLGEAAAEPAA
jgi:hypothetical protein